MFPKYPINPSEDKAFNNLKKNKNRVVQKADKGEPKMVIIKEKL